MKKSFLLAVVFTAGIAGIAVAQLSSQRNISTSKASHVNFSVQDTTKNPVKDTLPLKTDSIPSKKDSSSINL
jgi:hypothetical protein